jgi:hypothetical protein
MGRKIYEPAPAEVTELITLALTQWHVELHETGVKIGATMVAKFDADEALVPCLKHHGNWAAATIHIVRPSQRHRVDFDAEIFFDKARWEAYTQEQRQAVVDHELNHVVLVKDRQDVTVMTDHGPKIKLKPDDFAPTGFYEIINRHGAAAVEYQSIVAILTRIAEHCPAIYAQISRPEPVTTTVASTINLRPVSISPPSEPVPA